MQLTLKGLSYELSKNITLQMFDYVPIIYFYSTIDYLFLFNYVPMAARYKAVHVAFLYRYVTWEGMPASCSAKIKTAHDNGGEPPLVAATI